MLRENQAHEGDAAYQRRKRKGRGKTPTLCVWIHDTDPHPHQYPYIRPFENEGQQSEDNDGDENISHGLSGEVKSISDVKNIANTCPYPWMPDRVILEAHDRKQQDDHSGL
ncbi:MAG: hypothetical protein NTAFB09_22840 [Nitrosospira sp.]